MKIDRLVAIACGLAAFVLIAGVVGAYLFANSIGGRIDDRSAARGRERQAEEVQICERANIGRGNLLLDAMRKHDHERILRYEATLPLIDCVASVQTGDPDAPLPEPVVQRFVRILAAHQTPRRVPGPRADYVQ